MWSHFCKQYKQGRALAESPVKGDHETAGAGIANAGISSYIALQSAAAASAFLNASWKDGIKSPTEGSLPPASKGGSPSSSSSDSGSLVSS